MKHKQKLDLKNNIYFLGDNSLLDGKFYSNVGKIV